MYNLLGIILPLLVAILGVYMFTQPVKSTKEELRDNEEAVNKVKKNGLLLMIVGFLVCILEVVVKFVL